MTFLVPALVFGAAALSLPLLIHIFNRSRFRTVEWGAMHLLESVIKVNHRRFRIEQLILLLIRCAIPVLLALCLARPVLTGSTILEGDSPVSVVILLDTSYSMDVVGPAGSTFQAGVDAASAIVNATPKGSEVAVMLTGGHPSPLFDQPVFDAEAVVRRLNQLQGGFGASDMAASFEEALTTLTTMTNARRELVVISDFQPADWDAAGLDTDSITRRLAEMEIPPTLSLLQVGESPTANICVESLEIPTRALGVGQQFSVRTSLRNFGDTAHDHARVILRVDGKENSVSQISLAAKGSTQTLFPVTFEKAGSHVIEVEVVADDPLPTDNRFAAAVTIWDSIPVLLVDGDPSPEPLRSETDFLSVALTPYTFGRVRLTDLVETETIPSNELTEEHLTKTRVVVLANVSQLTDLQLAALSTYVRHGGALLVTAGDRIDRNWYQQKLYNDGNGMLPVAFGELQGKIDDQGKASRIVTQHFDHPALEYFNEPSNGDLSTAEIRRWHRLSTDADPAIPDNAPHQGFDDTELAKASGKGVNVLVRIDTGEPLLLEKAFGDGIVLQLATTADADWTDLPMRPTFVPFVQQLVTTMASRISPPRNIETGMPAVALIPNDELYGEANIDSADSSQQSQDEPTAAAISVVTPDGARRTFTTSPQGRMQVARFDATNRPGIYNMTLPSTRTLHFVAETSRDESRPDVLNETGMATLSKNLSAIIVNSAADYIEQDRTRRHGREIWRYVLAAVLAFMFLEIVLQQKFARVRT